MIDTYKNKERIYFNNINLRQRYGMVATDESLQMEVDCGVTQSANMNNGALVKIDRENYQFTLRFCRYNFDGKLSNFDYGPLLQEITEMFQGDEYNVLMIGSKIYYVVVTGIKHTRVNRNISYLDVSFQSLSPYAYSAIAVSSYRVTQNKQIQLKNMGITSCWCDVQIDCYEAGTVTITNNGKKISVVANKGDRLFIYGENADTTDFSKIDGVYEALKLNYGINRLKLDCSEGSSFEVTFQYQEQLALF